MAARAPRLFPVALAAVLAAGAAGCGKKGPPLAPLRLQPARISDLSVRRDGDRVTLQFTVPSANTDGSTPADLRAVEVLALTPPASGPALGDERFIEAATQVAAIEVEPPRPAREEVPASPAPPDPRPAQGERATAAERLTDAALRPVPIPVGGTAAREPAGPTPAVTPPGRAALEELGITIPAVSPTVPPSAAPIRRFYAVVGRSRAGRLGPLSARVGLPLTPPPPAPPAPAVRYTETVLEVTWDAAPGARQPSFGPAPEGALVARPLIPEPPAQTYNVYAAEPDGTVAGDRPAVPLNPLPLDARAWTITPVPFEQARCFVVRTVEAGAGVTVESEASVAACVTPRDTFPPVAPTSLAAVGSEGAINLIWEPSTDADLAGYLVLRGEGDGPLAQLTPAPVRETTYRDTAVRAGVRYVYAVVAVDAATPPNASGQSNRVEETAR